MDSAFWFVAVALLFASIMLVQLARYVRRAHQASVGRLAAALACDDEEQRTARP